MKEALSMHMEHEEDLQRASDRMGMANRQLVAEKELNQQLVAEKISQARLQRKAIKELQVSDTVGHMRQAHRREGSI